MNRARSGAETACAGTSRRRRIVAAVASGLVVAGAAIAGFDHWQHVEQRRLFRQTITALTRQSGLAAVQAAATTVFDGARMFVNDHSVHNIDAEFYALWRAPDRVAAALLDHAQGRRPDKPHLECSTRTTVLGGLLQELGFATRRVVIFNTDQQLESHTFLEVLNPQTGHWEIQDPDYDIYWQEKASRRRAGIAAVIADPQAHEPCGRERCGWDHPSSEGQTPNFIRPFLKVASIIDKARGHRFTIYHPDFDPRQRFTYADHEGTFCQLLAKNCRQGLLAAAGMRAE